jgi:hypothetical protein
VDIEGVGVAKGIEDVGGAEGMVVVGDDGDDLTACLSRCESLDDAKEVVMIRPAYPEPHYSNFKTV